VDGAWADRRSQRNAHRGAGRCARDVRALLLGLFLLTTGLVLAAPLLTAPTPAHAADSACAPTRAPVVVDTAQRQLYLCKDGREVARYRVNLGQGGVGKRAQGDQKTPLGRYPLAKPRPSVSGFTSFVAVGYPTQAQRALGYTGGAIGIHGPPDYLPAAVVAVAFESPWTDGCIMVATKAEIEEVAAWITKNRARSIDLIE
jgi:murein L,D-transpeptidase YafK